MKKKSSIFLVVFVSILFTGCTGEALIETVSSNSAAVLTSAETTRTEINGTPTPTQDTSQGTLGDFSVSIHDYDLLEDYKGNPAIRVYYELTNNSAETIKSVVSISCMAYQNGSDLETAFVIDRVEEDDNILKDIEPKAALVCTGIFILDDKSPVLIEVKGYFDSKKLTKILNLIE